MDISASADSLQRAGATTINWGGRAGVMEVEPGGTLALEGIVSQNVPSAQEWRQSTEPELYVASMALLPSVLITTDAQVWGVHGSKTVGCGLRWTQRAFPDSCMVPRCMCSRLRSYQQVAFDAGCTRS